MRSKDGYGIEIEKEMRGYFESLSEKDARRYAAIEARKLGHGGITEVCRILCCSPDAIRNGLSELSHLPTDPLGNRIRAVGGGRKKSEVQAPEIKQQISETIQTRTAGDPMQAGVTWTDMSPSQISAAVEEKFKSRVSNFVIRRILASLSYGRRKILKAKTKKSVPDRNLQFEKIAELVEAATSAANPVFSIDTKKKEPLGQLHRSGTSYSIVPIKAWDHDFANWAEGIIVPHGIYDLQRNTGWLNIGTSCDTSEFATDSFKQFWNQSGKHEYAEATEILILCDGGGSNGARTHIFKSDLQTVVNEIGVPIRVAHYPPYCSKYNPIERRLFSHVTRACQGVLFDSLQTAVDLMKKTSTTKGLKVTVEVISKIYMTGRKVAKDFRKNTTIQFDTRLPLWNYLVTTQI